SSEANYNCEPVDWVLPPSINSCPFGGLFFVDWICRNELSFTQTSHLYNPFNEGKPVKIARDGQVSDTDLLLYIQIIPNIFHPCPCRKLIHKWAKSYVDYFPLTARLS